MPALNVNLLKLLLVAALTVAGIKLTSLLPQGYYFSFASAFSDELGAFIIPRPLLAARQQCELERAKRISFRNCAEISETMLEGGEEKRQAIIQSVIETQPQFVNGGKLEIQLTPSSRASDPTADIKQIETGLESAAGLEETVKSFVRYSIRDSLWDFESKARDRFSKIYQQVEKVAPATTDPASEQAKRDVIQKIIRARQIFTEAVASRSPLTLEPLTLGEIESAVGETATDEYGSFSRIFSIEKARIEAAIKPLYENSIREAGLDVGARVREVDFAAMQQNREYVIALLIRLFVPLVIVFIYVLLTKDMDRLSMAVGTAFAAFVLAWPVAVLWSSVVSGSYVELRPVFLGFYTAYVISYLSAGFLGSTLALRLRGVSASDFAAAPDGGNGAVAGLFGGLPGQVIANFASNAATVAISYAYFGQDVIS